MKRSGIIKKRISEKLENYLNHFADKIIACKTNIIEDNQKKFKILDKTKFNLIRNGFDTDDYMGIKKGKHEKFLITYTGKLSEKLCYSPETFIAALGELIEEEKVNQDDINVLFVGSISDNYKNRFYNLIEQYNLSTIIRMTGYVNHKKCVEYQVNSDLLLLIIETIRGKAASYAYSGVIPAKIYEYIYSGTPIMAITPPGFESDLIKKTKTGFIAEPNNISSVKKLLYELYTKYKKSNLEIYPDNNEIKKYRRKHLTKRLCNSFDKIIGLDLN